MLLAGVVLRFWSTSPLWLDEAQSLAIARLPVPDLFEGLREDGSPPLYYVLLRGWTSLVGTGDVALRALSGILSVLALPLMWWAGRRIGGPRLGLIALLVLTANPWALRYATEARMYSLLVLLVLLAVFTLDRVLTRRSVPAVLALGVVTGLLLLTHYWTFFLLTAVGGALVVGYRRDPARRPALRRALLGLSLGVLVFLPWLPSFLYQIGHTGAPWADPPGLARLTTLPLEWSGGDAVSARWVVLLMWPLMLLGALSPWTPAAAVPADRSAARAQSAGVEGFAGFAGTGPRDTPNLALLPQERSRQARANAGRLLAGVSGAALLLALLVTRLTHSGIEVRYTAVVVPLVLLIVALGVGALPGRWATGVLAALVGLGLLTGWETARLPRTQAAEIAATLDRFAAPGDVIIYCPDQLGPAVERLAHTRVLTRMTVPQGSAPTIINWVNYEQRVAKTAGDTVARDAVLRAGDSTVWLLTSPRYRTHQALCGAVREGLLDRGAQPSVAVPLNPDAYEYAVLERWTGGSIPSTRGDRLPE